MAKSPYPHMCPGDVPLFSSFVLSPAGQAFDRWEFDTHLGTGTDPGDAFDPVMRKVAILLTQLRVDAIGWKGLDPTIFEVKPDARLSAFGQTLAYCWFWRQQFGQSCKRGIITSSITPQIQTLYDAYDIETHVVVPATPAQIVQAVNFVFNILPRR